jgi:flagellar basal-body rod protein FlgC
MDIFKVSASALEAQRTRMNTIASNMANAQTTRTDTGGPYQKKNVVFSVMPIAPDPGKVLDGVKVIDVVEDKTPPIVVFDPGHPDADDNGYVSMPNINVIEEMVNMMTALRAYEANVRAFNVTKGMYQKALELGRF